ncbi:MAG: hypothetical protein V4438_04340 [Patescibacteria group bacterium]
MPKPTQQEQFLRIKDFVDSVSMMANKLLRDVPKTLEILEQSMETDTSQTGPALLQLLKALREDKEGF